MQERYYPRQNGPSPSTPLTNGQDFHPFDPSNNAPSHEVKTPYSPIQYPQHQYNQYPPHQHNRPSSNNGLVYQQRPVVARPDGKSRKRKLVLCAIAAAAIILLILILGLGLGLGLRKSSPFTYVVSDAQVTNQTAFTNGGASTQIPSDVSDGIGAGVDSYTYYSGTWEEFPSAATWISFDDMWAGNLHMIQTSCKINYKEKDNSASDITSVYNAVQNRAAASLVDHRFILAVLLQESAGCVLAGFSTSSTGITNPGMMQSHNGSSYSSSHANESIYAMIQDGTQGTAYGSGLVQNLDLYGNAYSAARGYNSGFIPTNGNLSEAAGATACYVSDIANRLTGWVNGTRQCSES